MQLQLTCGLAQRVREIRVERFGKVGRPLLAEILGLPERTLANYESGVNIPALVILRFVELTGVTPRWLRTGHGDKYSVPYLGFVDWYDENQGEDRPIFGPVAPNNSSHNGPGPVSVSIGTHVPTPREACPQPVA